MVHFCCCFFGGFVFYDKLQQIIRRQRALLQQRDQQSHHTAASAHQPSHSARRNLQSAHRQGQHPRPRQRRRQPRSVLSSRLLLTLVECECAGISITAGLTKLSVRVARDGSESNAADGGTSDERSVGASLFFCRQEESDIFGFDNFQEMYRQAVDQVLERIGNIVTRKAARQSRLRFFCFADSTHLNQESGASSHPCHRFSRRDYCP
eukprot:Selendium_serpulae@DN6351_c1_g2_i2.p1